MSASKTLILIDQFLKLDDLLDLINSVPSTSSVRVLTKPDLREKFRQNRSRIDRLPHKIEVKFSERFHDRYVIANDTEYFHFGYSLKDLWKRRVSRYAKLYRNDEIQDLKDLYETEWKIAQTL